MKDRSLPTKPPLERRKACENFREDPEYKKALQDVTGEVTNLEEDYPSTVAGNHTICDHHSSSHA